MVVREDEIVEDEDNAGGDDGEDDKETGEDGDILMVRGKLSSPKAKAKSSKGCTGKHNWNHTCTMNLPENISPVKNLAASFLKLYIALEGAWLKYTSMNNTRLLNRHEVTDSVMMSVKQHLMEASGTHEVQVVFNELIGDSAEAESLRKMLTEVQTLKSGKIVKVLNFMFLVNSIIWVEGKRGRGSSHINEEKSQVNRHMPFQHVAMLELIYMFWFNRPSRAALPGEVHEFYGIHAAIKDHLQSGANNALNLQFSNKLLTYLSMKSLIWAHIRSRRTKRSSDLTMRVPLENDVPFNDLTMDEVNDDQGVEAVGDQGAEGEAFDIGNLAGNSESTSSKSSHTAGPSKCATA
ncbi:hypothetical protein DAEQUDRAFT_742135 [Daedalea quercina L-15889]|uniref:Uncharacterized protein n=1 Tax=Daedalea quercina L-15889 TaxID=1314783 RepID=A0A165KFL7_9APHY|nr:hypothetical protein DAEQUDRAFT_742135 [Daedalea quercina L-15889]